MAWQLVSNEQPCPICGKPDRCKIAPDGNAVKCFRVADENAEWRVTKKHATGGATFQLRNAQQQPRVARPAAVPAPSPRKTSLSSERLHEAYSLLLGKLSLEVLHRISLRERGLKDEQIAKFGYKSMPSRPGRAKIAAELASALGDDFAEVPGFAFVDGKPSLRGASGIAIPVRNANGEIVAVTIRADGDSAPKYTALSSAKYGGTSPGAPAHVPITVRAPATRVRITEGHLKADVINALDPITPTISCPGVGMYQKGIDAATELGAETIVMTFDADAPANHVVARNLLAAVRAIAAAGLQVELERWAIADGKGLDDLLAAGKKPELLTGDAAIAAAEEFVAAAGTAPASPWTQTSAPRPSSNDELMNRVQKVLDTGDISALFKSENAELLGSIAAINLVDRQLFSQIRTEVRKAKVPMKDFDFAMKKLIEAAAREQPPTISRDSYGGFFEDQISGCISRTRNSPDGPITVPMCNFIAYVVDETTRDDGAEKRIVLGLEGELSSTLSSGRKLPRVEVASDKFSDLRWVLEQWGTDAIVHPNESRALPSAILLLSQSGLECGKKRKVRRIVFEHTGWRDVNGQGQWCYLHANGALSGAVSSKPSFSVDLDPPLNAYQLPKPPVGEELKAAIRSSLALLTLAPRRLAFALLAATYRSVLGPCDFGVSLVGRSGIGKTAIAALMQQHFGATMDARHLPGSWSSTSNSLERLAFLCKDSMLVVDDYAPAGDANSVQKYRQSAERMYRSQGNNAGRQRMKSDGSLRAANPPRGLIVSTGEDVAGGQSARARQLILDISPGDINLPDLTPHQLRADEGVFASAMSGFINWIAPRYNKIQAKMRKQVKSLRDQAKSETQHARTPGIVADLQFGFLQFLEFARMAGAITEEQSGALEAECWAALSAAAKLQEAHHAASDPVQQFLRLLGSALGAGRVHVDDAEFGGPPDITTRTSWGWREDGTGKSKDWRPRGQRIGWVDDTCIFLDPTAAFAEVQKYASEQTLSIPVTQGTLYKMLATRGLLAATDPNRETLTIRKTFPGTKRTSVISLFVDCLSGVENPTNPTTSGDDDFESANGTVAIDAEERSSFPLTQAPKADSQPRGRVNGRVNLALPTTNGEEKPLENMDESECWSGWSGEITLEKVPAELEEYEF